MMRFPARITLLAIVLICEPHAVTSLAQQVTKVSSVRESNLNTFIKDYVHHHDGRPDKTVQYVSAFADLKDDGNQEALVYIMGQEWCGSGGCPLLILEPQGNTYSIITGTSVTQLPIRLLPTKTKGWHDLSVVVAGGGIIPGYEAKLSFDGRKYPSNPTIPPARPLKGNTLGQVLISQDAIQTPLNQ